jgi:cell division septation protein DedD
VSNRPAETPTGGFTVQVFAVRRKPEAQEIVDRLKKKGFPAYVWDPAPGDRLGGFRVRVGSFSSRQEAEAMATRLQKEEKFTPWITR